MGDERRTTVMVTGASRGIGRAVAVDLAARGYDLVLTARSVDGGATFDGTSRSDDLAGVALSGSISETAEECRRRSDECRVVCVAMDLTDEDSVRSAARRAVDEFGRVDALVSNAIYQGPGVNDSFRDLPTELLRRVIEGDAIAPMVLLDEVLPGMLGAGRGVFVHLTSGAATLVPKAPTGRGGWGVAYAMAKGAAHRIAGVLHAEHFADGIRAYSVNPGHVTTEVMRHRAERAGREVTGQGPDDTVATIAWLLAGDDDATALSGGEVVARDVAARLR
ncbi:MAG: SDR family NAD(P)-dependent oxidoreductase [Actinomycetota bacterium]|nr:SDR family NAD(P)-dependent oxidoreductase [Actinomycetota bacterium]MDA2972281.1 SDR family NAD(P)-dependent oxidoreductase [Actinomycetota bacterium]MDA3001392.1 SDR family NAD(P)-dependent oxidoreductase [Actinomycetota bacterium]